MVPSCDWSSLFPPSGRTSGLKAAPCDAFLANRTHPFTLTLVLQPGRGSKGCTLSTHADFCTDTRVTLTSNQSIGRAQKTRRLLCPVPHRIPCGAEKISDTCDIAISAKQRNLVVSPITNSRLM